MSTSVWNDAGLRSHARLAARLTDWARGELLYVHGTGWHHWDGTRWAPDVGEAHAYNLLQRLLVRSWDEALQDKELASDVRACNSASGMRGVLDIAQRNLFTEQVDADPWKLNTPAGTLDLRTLDLSPHAPDDRITKITSGAYDPNATCDEWLTFLESSLPDEDVREFLQRYAGSALIGTVLDHVLVVLTGSGRNGKGVFAETLQLAFGDYAITASNDLLIKDRHGAKSAQTLSSMMDLRGARLAAMSELDNGAVLAEATMKSLTGGDTIRAKMMHQDWVSFTPSHSFVLLSNDLPKADPTATAVWARMKVVPFEVSFEGREDTGLRGRLAGGLDAVLTWAVAGLWAYQQQGLGTPEKITNATSTYRDDNDSVHTFLDSIRATDSTSWATRGDTKSAYDSWAYRNEGEHLSPRQFNDRMRALGVQEKRTKRGDSWVGIALPNSGGDNR